MIETPTVRGKTILVTGANQGIGKSSAIALGKLGARVVLVCRNANKGRAAVAEVEQAGAQSAELLVADMSSQSDIRRVASDFKTKHQRLDVLLNNAGVFVPARHETVDGIEETFAVNHIGYFLLTTLLLDVLTASGASRIVNVSSEAHRGAKMRWDDLQFKEHKYSAFRAYGQSKLANILFTRALARRIADTPVTANCLHPGVIASGFGHTYGGFMSTILTLFRPLMLTNDDGAKTSVHLASSPSVEGVTGKYFDKCRERKPSAAALDEDAPERLWAISEKLTSPGATSGAHM